MVALPSHCTEWYICIYVDDAYKDFGRSLPAGYSTAANGLSRFIRVLTIMEGRICDERTYFFNIVMIDLAMALLIRHQFPVNSSHWVNGTTEKVIKLIQGAFLYSQTEMNLELLDRPSCVVIVQCTRNKAPVRRLGCQEDGYFLTPLKLMTGTIPVPSWIFLSKINGSSVLRTNLCRKFDYLMWSKSGHYKRLRTKFIKNQDSFL